LIFSGETYGQVTLTNDIVDMQAFPSALDVWFQGGGNVTISSITAPSAGTSTMNITNCPISAVSVGSTIVLASYGTNRMTVTGKGSCASGIGSYTVTNTNPGSFSGTGHGDTGNCTNPTIFGNNTDPSGSLNSTQMNEWGNSVVPQC
jgi:hypothetical protein